MEREAASTRSVRGLPGEGGKGGGELEEEGGIPSGEYK